MDVRRLFVEAVEVQCRCHLRTKVAGCSALQAIAET